jgi:hypothetical protein
LIKLVGVKFAFLFGGSSLMLGGLIIAIVSAEELKSFMGSFCAIAFVFGTFTSLTKLCEVILFLLFGRNLTLVLYSFLTAGLTDASWNTLFYEVWGNYWTKKIETAFGGKLLTLPITFTMTISHINRNMIEENFVFCIATILYSNAICSRDWFCNCPFHSTFFECECNRVHTSGFVGCYNCLFLTL